MLSTDLNSLIKLNVKFERIFKLPKLKTFWPSNVTSKQSSFTKVGVPSQSNLTLSLTTAKQYAAVEQNSNSLSLKSLNLKSQIRKKQCGGKLNWCRS